MGGSALKDEVLKVKPVQKQTRAGQRTRFKATVVVGDSAGHVGLGVKCSKEVANAIRAAIILAKLSVIPIRRGYWGTKHRSMQGTCQMWIRPYATHPRPKRYRYCCRS